MGKGKWKEKGVILKSAVSPNVKVSLALWENEDTGELTLLAKPTVRRLDRHKRFQTTDPYKVWSTAKEVIAMRQLLERASVLMDEYEEGTLKLKDVLAEDEDARLFTRTASVMFPTLDGMFDMAEGIQREEPKPDNGAVDTDPNDQF